MKKLLALVLMVFTASIGFAGNRPVTSNSTDQVAAIDHDQQGTPTFIVGNLGMLGAGSVEESSRAFMKANKHLFNGQGSEDFEQHGNNEGNNNQGIAAPTHADQLGQSHVRLAQTINGLPVAGGELIVHSDRTGRVFAVNGRFAPDKNLPRTAQIDGRTAVVKAVAQAGIKGWTSLGSPVLTYVVTETSRVHLAWVVRVSYKNNGPQTDKIYADAITGNLVVRAPEYYYAKSRATYTANNGSTLPGTLRISEGGATTGDIAIDDAHIFAGNVYDFYKNAHGRDSYDNAGAQIVSSAHYLTNYNNAFWNSSQMVYGDGDGVTFRPLSEALDVDAHELSHAVTERTANLVYSNESGALNEANSDIQGNSCEAYTRNGWTPNAATWMVGEDIYVPAGQALRYMDDPAKDGSSSDWYPTRYTGTSDNGGVHTNSGIANLAFYKMVMGGTHPRGKSSVNVTPLSPSSTTAMQMASKIQFRALTVYMTSTTNFQGARTATAQAATDLYGAAAAATVQSAWDLVGVPGGSTGAAFAMSASPSSVTIAQGGSGTSTITTTISGGFNSAISLSASGAPSGASVSLSPTSIAAPGSGSSTLTINVGAGTATGNYTITVTGTGGTITHTATVALSVTVGGGGGGPLTNGGFETGSLSSWTSTGVAAASTAAKHTGSYGAQLGNGSPSTDSTLTQTFNLPAGATSLSFWYANTCPDTVTYDWATATIKDNVTNTTSTLLAPTCTATAVWTSVSWNAAASAGHSVTLTLTNHDDNYSGDPTFTYFDDVAVAAGGGTPAFAISASPTSASAAQGGSATSTISTSVSGGFNSAIALSASGAPAGTTVSFNPASIAAPGAGSSTMTISVGASTATGTYTITVTGTGGSLTHTATVSLTVTPGGGTPQQLIQNPGFESGTTPWVTSAGVIDSSASEPAHSGSWKAWMNGYGSVHTDTVQQTVTIPANVTSATLSFWLHIDTAETTTTSAFDTLNVQIRNSSGTVLATLATYSNLNHNTGYAQKSFNVLAYKGQTIQVYLVGSEDASAQTSFVVDDFALNVQ